MYRNHNKAKFTWHYVYRHLWGGMCKPAAMGLDAGLDLESKATEMDEERRLLMRITGKSFSIAI